MTKSITPPRLADTLAERPAGAPWASELWLRFRRLLWLKTVGISAFMWLFFIAYFELLRHPVVPVRLMPLTALDRAIDFQPAALVAYLSLWIYVGIAPGLMLKVRAMIVHGLWATAMCLVGLACFRFWPTAVPAVVLDTTGHPAFALLQGVDAAGNACPSMHVAAAIFTTICLDPMLRRMRVPSALRWLNVAWFVAIAYSTLAVKQHVVVDVLAGALLGTVFALAALRWRPHD